MWRKLIGVLRDFGPGVGLLYLFDRALRALPGRSALFVYDLMVQPIEGQPLLPGRLARHITWREIDAGDAAVARMPARDEVKQWRFAHGARCLGVERKGELLGYVWFSRDSYDEDEVRCTYCLPPYGPSEPTDVFDFDLFLFPEHRMGIGFVALWHAASAYLHAQGVRCSHSRMTRFNLASRRAHLRLGSRIAGRAVFLRLGGIELMGSTLRPFAALSWSRRVRLHLPANPMPPQAPHTEAR